MKGEIPMTYSYDETDALVLSVIYTHHEIDLFRWIGMIDLYERTILGFDEWKSALEKLQICGLICFSNNAFQLSAQALKLFPKQFNIRNYEKISAKLSKQECIPTENIGYIFSETEYLEALRKYRKTIYKQMKR